MDIFTRIELSGEVNSKHIKFIIVVENWVSLFNAVASSESVFNDSGLELTRLLIAVFTNDWVAIDKLDVSTIFFRSWGVIL